MPKTHHLKTLPVYFDAVRRGDKTFDIRKNDRDFQTGDTLVLEEFKGGPPHAPRGLGQPPLTREELGYTGNTLEMRVSSVSPKPSTNSPSTPWPVGSPIPNDLIKRAAEALKSELQGAAALTSTTPYDAIALRVLMAVLNPEHPMAPSERMAAMRILNAEDC